MGFFDNILEEQPQAAATAATVTAPADTATAVTENKGDDGSFLILKDEIKAEDIPNSAVSFFEPTATEAVTETPAEVTTTEATPAEVAFFDVETPKAEEVVAPAEEVKAEEAIAAPAFLADIAMEAPAKEEAVLEKIEKKEEDAILSSFVEMKAEEAFIPRATSGKSLKEMFENFIADLKARSASYDPQIEAEMKEVEAINAKIAELKQEAKTRSEAAKKLAAEQGKVNEMEKLLEAQLEKIA